jgi:hypothetical protein
VCVCVCVCVCVREREREREREEKRDLRNAVDGEHGTGMVLKKAKDLSIPARCGPVSSQPDKSHQTPAEKENTYTHTACLVANLKPP